MRTSVVQVLLGVVFMVCGGMVWAGGSQEVNKVKLPEPPPFDSVAQPADSGKVTPVKKSEKPIRIAVLGLEDSAFWAPVKEGALAANKELKPFNGSVDWIVPPGEAHTSNFFGVAIEGAVAQQYDAIATIAGDSGIVSYINRAVDRGIPVATFNVETDTPSKRLFFVGADLYSQGRSAGKAFVDFYRDRGVAKPKVAVITGFFSVEGLELRRKGFHDYVNKNLPGVVVAGEVECKDKDEIAYQQANDFLTANPDLNAFYVAAGGKVGTSRAIEERGLGGKVFVFAFDFEKETIEYVRKGIIAGTISQQPFAQGHDPAIRLFNYLVAGVVPPAGRLNTRSDFLTKDNLSEFGF